MKQILSIILILLTAGNVTSQGLYDGVLTTPLPYFDEYEAGYVILRDGTRLEGEVDIKKYESQGKMDMKDKSGNKYRFAVESLREWGLDVKVPENYSPLSYFDWKNDKRKENKEAERGFIKLKSGEVLEGKIKIEGWSSESALAGNDFFALETLTLIDKTGKETEYEGSDLDGYGRILPWEFAPRHLFMSQAVEAFGKRKTKKLDGFALMMDGTRIEGPMQLVIKNSMKSDSKIKSDVIDEIFFERSGADEKIDLDDIFAYGIKDITINDITNNGDIKYTVDEMNFHPGTVTKKGGTTKEGLVAYFPEIGNYYGVYVATSVDEPVEIIALKDIENVEQRISLITEYGGGYGAAPSETKKNTNINGYIVDLKGAKYKGTISLNDDHDWWVRSITFVDEESREINYGGTQYEPISYFVLGETAYVHNKNVFVKTKMEPTPLAYYDNPYVDKSNSFGNMLLQTAVAQASADIGNHTTAAVWSAQVTTGLDTGSPELGMNIGSKVTEGLNLLASKVGKPSDTEPEKDKKGDYNIFNAGTGEWVHAEDDTWEILLEGCMDYLKADKNKQKAISKYTEADMVTYLNKCYSKE